VNVGWMRILMEGRSDQHLMVVDGVSVARVEECSGGFSVVMRPEFATLEQAKRFAEESLKLNKVVEGS
jgi:hypothetical protein